MKVLRNSLTGFIALIMVALCAETVRGAEAKKPRPDLTGQPATPFSARAVDSKAIKFPDDYKGKVVLLDFWATWCGPCRAELPNVVAAYQQFHSRGFEVIGISLDQAQQGPNLLNFLQQNNMTWPQIYDGKYWKAALAVKYDIRSIPRAILVDGDTGIILADGSGARGTRLAASIEKALASKTKK